MRIVFISILMGNYCDNEVKQIGFPDVVPSNNFIRQSWELLKKHKQISFLSSEEEHEIVSQLNCIPHRKGYIKILAGIKDRRFFVIKQDAFFYLGNVEGNLITGSGAVVLPNSKIYVGQFKDGRAEGPGAMQFLTSSTPTPKTVGIQGDWGASVNGNIMIGSDDPAFPFQADMACIADKKNFRYIQYPNYDEYIGETEEDLAHGQGKYIYRNGHKHNQYPVYEGGFNKGKREGSGVMKLSASMELSIKWTEGKPDGLGFMMINGNKNSVLYKSGKRIEKILSDVE